MQIIERINHNAIEQCKDGTDLHLLVPGDALINLKKFLELHFTLFYRYLQFCHYKSVLLYTMLFENGIFLIVEP